MFDQLIYIILFLLLLLFAPTTDSPHFGPILLSWILLLAGIAIQNRFIRSIHLVYVEILFVLGIAFFEWGLGALFKSQTAVAFISISFLLSALTVYHRQEAWRNIRLILPFFLPFLAITIFSDLIDLTPFSWQIQLGLIIAFFIPLALLLPKCVVWLWDCQNLPDQELAQRLEALANRAHYRHVGFKLWATLPYSLTAAIIGLTPSSRYILLTPPLINYLSPLAVEAVVAHEMGHSYHRHLLLLPMILAGGLLPIGLLPYFDISTLLLYGFFIVLYYRFLFGFYLRLYERQADLYGKKIGVPIEGMIEALHSIGVYSGNTHLQPSWHHFSIQERIDFLQAALKDPQIAATHDRKVRQYTLLFCLFFFCVVALYFVF